MKFQFVFDQDAFNTLQQDIYAVRETTQEERQEWIRNRVKSGQNMLDCAGESILPPNCFKIDLLGKEIMTDKILTKVPFKNQHYYDFVNYGSIKVSEPGKGIWETYYLPKCHAKTLKKLGEDLYEVGKAAMIYMR